MILSKTATELRARISATLGIALLLSGSPSYAQGARPDAGIAEQLFLEGKALMIAKEYVRACEKLQASYDLDRTATGTLLNLALCHELINKPATAWAEFRLVAADSAGRREDRVALAREHEAKLAPILSRVRIEVPGNARAPGLTIQIDEGQAMPEATWGTELNIDPGKHVLHVSAPHKLPRSVEFSIGDLSDRKTVVVQELAGAPVAVSAGDVAAAEARRDARHTRRVIGFALGGAGIAAAGVGIVFGVIASNNNQEAKELCNGDVCDNETIRREASDKLGSANNAANVSNVLVGVGGLLLAGGVVMVLTALPEPDGTKPAAKAATLRATAAPIPNGGAVLVGGVF